MRTEPLISVVVPVLDEQATIAGLLDHLASLPGRWETIVADGGSRDRTASLAAGHAQRPTVIQAPRGRANQMNAGAAAAAGDVLLFLHADTRLPAEAYASLVEALHYREVLGGNFRLDFDGGDRFSRLLGAWYRVQRRLGVYYGDSAVWLRRGAFDALGGFRTLPIMEDYDLVRRLECAGAAPACRAPP